jgi:tetratricopeptide (TPR) repeat protein
MDQQQVLKQAMTLGNLEFYGGNYSKSLKHYSDALNILRVEQPFLNKIEQSKMIGHIYLEVAQCHSGLQNNIECKKYLTLALQKDPISPSANYLMGNMLLNGEHRPEEAITFLENAIRHRFPHSLVYYYLALAFQGQAANIMRKMQSMNDADFDTYTKTVVAIHIKAKEAILKALQDEPNNMEYNLVAGRMQLYIDFHVNGKNFSQAKSYLVIAANLGSDEAKQHLKMI